MENGVDLQGVRNPKVVFKCDWTTTGVSTAKKWALSNETYAETKRTQKRTQKRAGSRNCVATALEGADLEVSYRFWRSPRSRRKGTLFAEAGSASARSLASAVRRMEYPVHRDQKCEHHS
jgi:hypothetical protein